MPWLIHVCLDSFAWMPWLSLMSAMNRARSRSKFAWTVEWENSSPESMHVCMFLCVFLALPHTMSEREREREWGRETHNVKEGEGERLCLGERERHTHAHIHTCRFEMNMCRRLENTAHRLHQNMSRDSFIRGLCLCKGWLRLVGSLKLQVSLAEYSLFYRALSQKKPVILSRPNLW